MASDNSDNRARLGSPPVVSPRSSSLGAPTIANAEDIHKGQEGDATASGSDGEKERVRERLKKTSIAGIRSESQSRGPDTSSNITGTPLNAEPESTELPKEMDVSAEDKSDSGGSRSSSQTRKRSRDPEDNGDDALSVDKDAPPRPRAHGRKRSRELSDGPENKEARAEGSAEGENDEDETMAHSQITTSEGSEKDDVATTPPAKMDEDAAETMPESSYTSPSRKDGRKRVREEEGDADPAAEEVKIKRPLREEGEASEEAKKASDKEESSRAPSENVQGSDNDKEGTPAKSETPEPAKLPPGSGFANTSAKSPFATAAAGAKPLFGSGATTASLFAASKFGAMSSSSASPFATHGSSSGSASPFGGLGGSSPKPSPFTSTTSGGFGSLGSGASKPPPSGFGALAAKAGGQDVISGAPKTTRIVGGSKPAKPFGAPEDYEGEGSEGEEGGSDEDKGEDKKAKEDFGKTAKCDVFQETEVITGEENEVTICHYRARSYHFDSTAKAWKERGVGNLKLLATKIDLNDVDRAPSPGSEDELKRKFRLVMRADAVHKVILNVPLTEKLIPTYGEQGNMPTGNNFRLVGIENGKETMLLVKLRNPSDAKALYTHIIECLLGPEVAAQRLAARVEIK